MGWCSGTPIFDTVCEEVLELSIPQATKERILSKLIEAMEDHDWDCQGDSEYYDHQFVGKLLGNNDEPGEVAIEDVVACFTGFRDADLQSVLEDYGASVASSLTKDVTHLIAGKKSLEKGSSKIGKAVERGIWVGTVGKFLDEFDIDYEQGEEE